MAIAPELRAQILRLYQAERWRVGTIARQLNLHRDTVKLEREERRDALRIDTLQAWEDYRATGLHATADEVDAWLATWGTDDERPAPARHN